jgi:hypothetical protein
MNHEVEIIIGKASNFFDQVEMFLSRNIVAKNLLSALRILIDRKWISVQHLYQEENCHILDAEASFTSILDPV